MSGINGAACTTRSLVLSSCGADFCKSVLWRMVRKRHFYSILGSGLLPASAYSSVSADVMSAGRHLHIERILIPPGASQGELAHFAAQIFVLSSAIQISPTNTVFRTSVAPCPYP